MWAAEAQRALAKQRFEAASTAVAPVVAGWSLVAVPAEAKSHSRLWLDHRAIQTQSRLRMAHVVVGKMPPERRNAQRRA